MPRHLATGICLGLLLIAAPADTAPAAAPARGAKAPPASAAAAPRMRTVTLHMFHRVFPDFHDQVEAQLRKEFRIGDTEYTATVTEYIPDFAMDTKTKRISSRGAEPNNPAFKIIVKKKGVPADTTWALLNMAPHFSRNSLIAFLAARVTFENHAPVMSRDSIAIRLSKPGGK